MFFWFRCEGELHALDDMLGGGRPRIQPEKLDKRHQVEDAGVGRPRVLGTTRGGLSREVRRRRRGRRTTSQIQAAAMKSATASALKAEGAPDEAMIRRGGADFAGGQFEKAVESKASATTGVFVPTRTCALHLNETAREHSTVIR